MRADRYVFTKIIPSQDVIRYVRSDARSSLYGLVMTLRTDVARSRDLLACWRELAEKRLEYLTEMFETGRWRRYYSDTYSGKYQGSQARGGNWRACRHPIPARNSIIVISWSGPACDAASKTRRVPSQAPRAA